MTLVIDITCKGSSVGQRVLLEDGETLNVGRANETLKLSADPRLSRQHFEIRYCNREIEITHLSKTNPTLVASEGSPDFVEVNAKQVEPRGCRIIAGSHRFVAVVEAPDSVIEPASSNEDQAKIWSDVASEEDQDPFFFDSSLEQDKQAGSPEDASAQATIPSPNIKPNSPLAVTQVDLIQPAVEPAKFSFPIDDCEPETPAVSSSSSDTNPEPPPTSKAPTKPVPTKTPDPSPAEKKIFFPIEDDFFD